VRVTPQGRRNLTFWIPVGALIVESALLAPWTLVLWAAAFWALFRLSQPQTHRHAPPPDHTL